MRSVVAHSVRRIVHRAWSIEFKHFKIVLRTPTLGAGSQFRISKFETLTSAL